MVEKRSIFSNLNIPFEWKVWSKSYAKLFAMIFLLIFCASVVTALFQTPKFEASARLIVEARKKSMLPTEEVVSEMHSREASIVDTEVEALHSPALLRRVVDDLKLYSDMEFSDDLGNRAGTVSKLLDAITISRAGQTFIVDISAKSFDPDKAANIANILIKHHLAMQVETKRRANREASKLLLERIDEMADQVEMAESDVQRYKLENGLANADEAESEAQSILAIEGELARAKASEGAALGALNSARSGRVRYEAAQTPALEQLLIQQATADEKWQLAREKYGELHPRYKDARASADELRQAVANEKSRARSVFAAGRQQDIDRLKRDWVAASQRHMSLVGSAKQVRQALSANIRAQVRLNILQRKAQAVRATYEAYLGRYQETTTQIGTEQPDSRILSPARIPSEPASPNRLLVVFFGGLFGLAMAASITTAMAMYASAKD